MDPINPSIECDDPTWDGCKEQWWGASRRMVHMGHILGMNFSQCVNILPSLSFTRGKGFHLGSGFSTIWVNSSRFLTMLHTKTCLLQVRDPFLNFILHDNNKLGFSEILCINIVNNMMLKTNYINNFLILSFKSISNVI